MCSACTLIVPCMRSACTLHVRTALHLISHAVLQRRDLPSAPQALALPLPALRSGARLVLQRAYTRLSYSYPYAP